MVARLPPFFLQKIITSLFAQKIHHSSIHREDLLQRQYLVSCTNHIPEDTCTSAKLSLSSSFAKNLNSAQHEFRACQTGPGGGGGEAEGGHLRHVRPDRAGAGRESSERDRREQQCSKGLRDHQDTGADQTEGDAAGDGEGRLCFWTRGGCAVWSLLEEPGRVADASAALGAADDDEAVAPAAAQALSRWMRRPSLTPGSRVRPPWPKFFLRDAAKTSACEFCSASTTMRPAARRQLAPSSCCRLRCLSERQATAAQPVAVLPFPPPDCATTTGRPPRNSAIVARCAASSG